MEETHKKRDVQKNILVAFLLNFFFAIIEVVGGILTNSVAILSDAFHDFGDCASIGVAYFLEKKSKQSANKKNTFGYARYSVFAGFITCAVLVIGGVLIVYECIKRLLNPVSVNAWGMIILAIVGIVINGLAVLRTQKATKINEKSVNLHLWEDTLTWGVVLIGSVAMLLFGITWIDSVMSIAIAVVIMASAIRNLIAIFSIFLQRTPKDFPYDEFVSELKEVGGVQDLHHLHIWTIDGENTISSMHVVVADEMEKDEIIKTKHRIAHVCEKYKIVENTLQIELAKENCSNLQCNFEQNETHHHHHHHH